MHYPLHNGTIFVKKRKKKGEYNFLIIFNYVGFFFCSPIVRLAVSPPLLVLYLAQLNEL